MEKRIQSRFIVLISTLFMLLSNSLANIVKFNNVSTKQVSDMYSNLFAPAPITFLVWFVIYCLLIGVVVQFFKVTIISESHYKVVNTIGILFSISNVINGIWMIFWHYNQIGSTVILMIALLSLLIYILILVDKHALSSWFQVSFGAYLGWISVATIANVTAYLVSIGWDRFNASEALWTGLTLLVGLVITSAASLYFKNSFYMIVVLWAYSGILIAHTSSTQWNGKYPLLIGTVVGCIAIQIVILLVVLKGSLSTRKLK